MTRRRPRLRRRRPDDPTLSAARDLLDDLEDRSTRAVRDVLREGTRNHFADRWRRTLPPSPGVAQ